MADITIISFRPINENFEDYSTIREWTRENKATFSGVINAFLPAIAYLLKNNVVKIGNKRYVRCEDMGDLVIPYTNYKTDNAKPKPKQPVAPRADVRDQCGKSWRRSNAK